jgi:hypothetical protein
MPEGIGRTARHWKFSYPSVIFKTEIKQKYEKDGLLERIICG